MPPEPFEFDRDGVRLVGDRWASDPARGVVVLLHGGAQTRRSWTRTAEALAQSGWTAITVDARGHGESDWDPAREYTLGGYVDDLLTLLRRLDDAPVLVGASLGGNTALVAEGEHPGIARGLVLVDIVPKVDPEAEARIHAFLVAHAGGFASLEDVAEALSAYNPQRPRPATLDGLRKVVRQRDDGRWYWHWDPAFVKITHESQRNLEQNFHPDRLRAAAIAIRVPTLLVRGAESDLVSKEGIDDMLELMPAAETADIPGAGHMVAGDDNSVFSTRLEAFLTSVFEADVRNRPSG